MSVNGGSSHGGSASNQSVVQNVGIEDKEVATSTFWNGCFGMLYTINKERRLSILFFTFKYLMEFLQLAFLMMGVQYGWQFDASNKGWQLVELIQVRPFMALIGRSLFVVLFVGFVLLLLACVIIYVWAFFCFQNNKFDLLWPLRLARLFGAVFFEALDVMAMSLLVTAIDCRYYSVPKEMEMHSFEFPSHSCLAMPMLIYYFVGIFALVVFVTMAGFNKLAQMDLNPATRNLDAYAHPGIELWNLSVKVLMVLGSVFLNDYRHLAIFWLLCSVVLVYFFWKWEPMVVAWVNYLRTGTFTAVLYVSCLFMALQFPMGATADARDAGPLSPQYGQYTDYVKVLQYALLGVLPAAAVGATASYFRLRHYRVTLTQLFRDAPPGVKARTIYKFESPREVELVTRCCRVWVDAETLQIEAIALAERVVKAGLASLPNSPWMIIWYTSFLVDVQGSFQSGFTQLQVALKLDPSFIDMYAIFSREQDHSQKSATGRSGQHDVLSDVEFQKNYKLALHTHKEALMALKAFWQLLQHSTVKFENLVKATRLIDANIKAAERVYRSVVQRHSDQPRLLRLYAKFLEYVKHDPWGASRWIAEAEKLELTMDDSRQTNLLGLDEQGGDIGAGHVSRFSVGDDGEERALCVFNAHGMISMTNEAMREMFGYAKAELKDRSVAILMPPPFAEQTVQHVKSFVHTGRGAVVMRTSEFVAIHKDRHMFGARITIVRISGIGEDSLFLASLQALVPEPDSATVWVLTSGQVLSADERFRDWFGHRLSDVEGGAVTSLAANTKEIEGLFKTARHAMVLAKRAATEAAAQDEADENPTTAAMALLAENSSAFNKGESIVQALAAASAPPLQASISDSLSAIKAEWSLAGVRMFHKFAESMEVEVKLTNSQSPTYSMHVMRVRRTGVQAHQPLQHMMVTNPAGSVLHVTEDFSTLLGTTPKALMANLSGNAMEALMVQPFGLIHRAGLSASLPAAPPPSYSCRSGLSVLMPISGSHEASALPVRMQIKKRSDLDESFFVCTMQPMTWEQALDERSLRLVVNDAGIILSAGESPSTLFDLHPSALVGRKVASYINVFQAAPDAPALLMGLASRAMDAPGSTWRVGVGFTYLDAEVTAEAKVMLLNKQAKSYAAVMSVTLLARPPPPPPAGVKAAAALETEDTTGAAAAAAAPNGASGAAATTAAYELRLWRADMVTGVIEVDGNGMVVEGEGYLQKLYPASAALGVSMNQMLGEHVRDFIPLGEQKYTDLFEEGTFAPVPVKGAANVGDRRKSNMKSMHPSEARRAGPQVLLHGRHRLDGMEMDYSVQIVRKGGQGAYLVVHPYNPTSGRPDLQQHILQNALSSVDIDAPRRSRRRSEVEADSQRAGGRHAAAGARGSIDAGARSSVDNRRSSVDNRRSNVDMSAALQPGADGTSILPGLDAIAAGSSSVGGGFKPSLSKLNPAAAASAARELLKSTSRSASVRFHEREEPAAVSEKQANITNWVNSNGSEYVPSRAPAQLSAARPGGGGGGDNIFVDDDEDDLGLLSKKCTFTGSGADDDLDSSDAKGPAETDDDGDGDHTAVKRGGGGGGSGKRRSGKYSNGGSSDGGGGGDHDSSHDDALNQASDQEEAGYRRGGRLKKLNRIFHGQVVTRHTARFKWHTVGVALLLAVTSVAVFVVMRTLIQQEIESVEDLNNMGQAARKMMRASVTTLDMGQMYQRWPNQFLTKTLPGLTNTDADLAHMKSVIQTNLDIMAENNRGTYEGFRVKRRMPVEHGLRDLWENPVLPSEDTLKVPTSEVGMDPVSFLPVNGSWHVIAVQEETSLYDGVQKVAAKIRNVLANAEWFNSTLVVGKRWVDWDSIMYLRLNVDKTYLPAYIETLDGYAQVVVDDAAKLNQVQLLILVLEGCVLAGLALAYMWYLCNQVDTNRYNIYCVFMVVPMAMVRTLANARTELGDDDSDDEGDPAAAMIKEAAAATETDPLTSGGKGYGAGNSSGGGGGRPMQINVSASYRPPPTGWARVLSCCMFWRSSAVAPSHERRKLTRSLRGVLWLTWPFALWGCIIILINALGHANLGNVNGPMMTFNIVNCVQCKFWRIIYQVAMLHYETDYAASAAILTSRLQDARLDYTCMLLGSAGVPNETSPHYTLVSQGVSNHPGPGQDILYDYTRCLSTAANGCLPVTDPFYPYTMHGLDTLVRRMFDVVSEMVQILQAGVEVTNSGPEMAFMWKIRESLIGGASMLVDAYKSQVQNVYTSTQTLQTIALIVTLVLVVLYLFCMLRPYLAEVAAERRRITELLTQLPVDIDVENLVLRALVGRTPDKQPPAAAAAAAAANGTSSKSSKFGMSLLGGQSVELARDSHVALLNGAGSSRMSMDNPAPGKSKGHHGMSVKDSVKDVHNMASSRLSVDSIQRDSTPLMRAVSPM